MLALCVTLVGLLVISMGVTVKLVFVLSSERKDNDEAFKETLAAKTALFDSKLELQVAQSANHSLDATIETLTAENQKLQSTVHLLEVQRDAFLSEAATKRDANAVADSINKLHEKLPK
jgi:hypothetical protein